MGNFYNLSGQIEHGEFVGVSEVYGTDKVIRTIHHADHSLYQVIDITEGACLCPVTKDRYVLISESLDNKVADDPSVVRMHLRAIGIEYPDNSDVNLVLPVIIEEEGLRAALPFVIAGSYADGVDVTPIIFPLWMDGGVSVDLAGGGLEYPGLYPFCQTQHMDGTHDAGLDGLDRVVLVVDRRSGTGQIVYLINFEEDGLHHVMSYEFEIGFFQEMTHVLLSTGEEIVQAQNIMTFRDQAITEVGTEEPGAAGN